MVSVAFKKVNDALTSLTMSGHAESADHGSDLVCAGISSIVFGALNGFDQLASGKFEYDIKDNYVNVNVIDDACITNKLLSFVYIQLLTVEEQYPENIKIKITEV